MHLKKVMTAIKHLSTLIVSTKYIQCNNNWLLNKILLNREQSRLICCIVIVSWLKVVSFLQIYNQQDTFYISGAVNPFEFETTNCDMYHFWFWTQLTEICKFKYCLVNKTSCYYLTTGLLWSSGVGGWYTPIWGRY